MSVRRPDLPDFDNPPVVETVLSVQFEVLSLLKDSASRTSLAAVPRVFPQNG